MPANYYVHFFADNTNYFAPEVNYAQQKIKQQNTIKGQSYKELEEKLNSYFNALLDKSLYDNSSLPFDRDAIIASVTQKLEQQYHDIFIDWHTLKVHKNYKDIRINKENAQHADTILRHLENLDQILNSQSNQFFSDNVLEKIKIYEDCKRQLIAAFNAQNITNNEWEPTELANFIQKTRGELTTTKNFVKSVNQLYNALMFVPPSAIGDVFEYSLSALESALQGTLLTGIDEVLSLINSSTVGMQRSKVTYDSNFFKQWGLNSQQALSIINSANKNNYIQGVNGNIVQKTREGTQEKVDVIYNLDNGMKPFKISAKNYNLSSTKIADVHIVSGTSLLYLLQGYGSFLADYANNTIYKIKNNVDQSIISPPYAESWHKSLKQLILLEALAGTTLLRSNDNENFQMLDANTFIIRDNSKLKDNIKVFSIERLFNIVNKNLNQYLMLEGDPIPIKERPWIQPPFTYVDYPEGTDASIRAAYILGVIRNIKINAGISKAVFQ